MPSTSHIIELDVVPSRATCCDGAIETTLTRLPISSTAKRRSRAAAASMTTCPYVRLEYACACRRTASDDAS